MGEIEKLRHIVEIQKQAMDRWCPCSGHRDKTPPKYCPVCENEVLFNTLKTMKGRLDALRLWFLWHEAFSQGKADAECEPCDPVETIKTMLKKVSTQNMYDSNVKKAPSLF